MNLKEMQDLKALLYALKDNASQARSIEIYNILDEVQRQIDAMEGN